MINPDLDRNLFFIWRGLLAWILIACAVMILSGCATRKYVDQKAKSMLADARMYSRHDKIDAMKYASTIEKDLDDLKKRIMTSSEVRMQMYREDYLKQIKSLERETQSLRKLIEE
jgi:Na+-transporting NADH:ubiquinone oxidoreductase subunit NqrC